MGWFWGAAGLSLAVAAGVALGGAARSWLAAVVLVAGAASGWGAVVRVEATLAADLVEGPIVAVGTVADEPTGAGRFVLSAHWVSTDARWEPSDLPPLVVSTADAEVVLTAGDRVLVRGTLRPGAGRVRGDPVAGRISRASVERLSSSDNPLFVVGNALRRRVAANLADADDAEAAALLSGFLIGDTSKLQDRDLDSLRRSGLTHFVAVSGSNVALFLAGWWLVTAPLAARPRVRSALGLIGLGIFVVVTRWEPSVVRAATMAGLVLGGRLMGVPIDTWTALGLAVSGLILLSGDLAVSVGFQLSVAATAGVLAGAGSFAGRRPKWVWTALAATLSAQAAVTPILLFHFGTVPLLSPLANLMAAPLVTLATALGGAGVVVGWDLPVGVALIAARGVLGVAHTAGGWPQLGLSGVVVAATAFPLARIRRLRPVLAAAAVVALASLAVPVASPEGPTVTFLDVGQGDAVLLTDETGAVVLVDGGRDPLVLAERLRRRGIRKIDLLVVTHGDGDHAGGLEGIVSTMPVGLIWIPDQPDLGEVLPGIVAAARERHIAAVAQRSGPRLTVGRFAISVLGPRRRYASPNDGSLVLWVEAGATTLLLPGDIEAVAQKELPPVRPDVLLVPHHGSATTDLDWLAATAGPVAVVSVGENGYGHPVPDVLKVLRAEGAAVWITQQAGDIVLPLG
jgi:competence protein ComEC